MLWNVRVGKAVPSCSSAGAETVFSGLCWLAGRENFQVRVDPWWLFWYFLFCFKFMIGKVICSDSEAKKDLYKKGNCIACNCSSVSCCPLLSSSQLDHAASFIKLRSPGWGTRQRTAGPAGCSQRNIVCVPGGARSVWGRPQGLFVFKQGCTRAAWLGLASPVCPSSKSHAQLWGKLNIGYLRTPAEPPLNDISSIIPT